MKGMQKIKRGKQFTGVVVYALEPASHHKTDPRVIGGNMAGNNIVDLIREFGQTKILRPDIKKPVWHNSLRLPHGEKLSEAQWATVADDYMSRMGFTDTHLRCYVLHNDKAGQHIHIIASRIDITDGKLYLGKNENLTSTRIISELERIHGLTETATTSNRRSQGIKKLSRNEKMLSERTATPCPKVALQTCIDNVLANHPDLLSFIRQLEQEGVTCQLNIASTGKMSGFSFQFQGIAFKASQLGKKYAWSHLQTLIDYSPEHVNLLNTRSKSAPAPCTQPEAQHPSRETILDKLLQLDEQIRNERENELAHTIQLNQKLRFTAHQISRQHQSHFQVWLPFLSRLIHLLRQLGGSLLYATARPFRQIYHLYLLASSPEPVDKTYSEQLVSNVSNYKPHFN
ncbi:relaxase/mobilization nuclease domain-containing protein [Enterobacter ludwigii]|uniref:relaxase/mobilization nuclease domain-containing protein n=1 Tax=Enterobacteriaceae TaxID=543 RepID=UPI000E2A78B2|nr:MULTISPECIES: relaxase/mobilization nuclease domain-containing protein [Enterobacteriaceae]EFH4048511.1 relaxase/mobilization nuclease domain-containing protein [Escherichia coli]MBP0721404.1 relaxase/mobilization nuclease domain-containing protein [Escherichia coli]MCC4961001.1 relaxase/mobilization nuclease domain-containing protein [Klebsiella pneumoniae]MDM3406170.1 relaxase/mobilization nuclease domain-containing protein [Citrobacter sp. Cb022]MEC4420119.1 relaxase/mobilization nucleas